ncbi:MAG: nodulation protein NfeD, partial [Bacteroidales bacterium]|nr:nodulation protein NfeD [Bacteroidales bacterium]
AIDKIINFLINPVISGILIMIIIGGIYFELQSPGIGFPLAAAVIAALLYFAPLYLEGLAVHWEILVFILGLILIAIEIFAIPGFGVTGILGILFIIFGLALSMIDNVGFDFSGIPVIKMVSSLLTVIIASTLAFVGGIYLSKKLLSSTRFGEIALNTVQSPEEGFTSADLSLKSLIGQSGKAFTDLRPVGKIEIADEVYDATAISGYIEKGQEVKVVKYETSQLFVVKL